VDTIREDELKRAITLLREAGTFGISREQLAPHFGGDRRARKILEVIRASGLAAVISGINPAGVQTYRIANDREEYRHYRNGLIARITALAQAVRGLDAAYRWEDDELTPLLERVIELGGQNDNHQETDRRGCCAR